MLPLRQTATIYKNTTHIVR